MTRDIYDEFCTEWEKKQEPLRLEDIKSTKRFISKTIAYFRTRIYTAFGLVTEEIYQQLEEEIFASPCVNCYKGQIIYTFDEIDYICNGSERFALYEHKCISLNVATYEEVEDYFSVPRQTIYSIPVLTVTDGSLKDNEIKIVKEEDHTGQIYNPITGEWKWL